MPRQSGTLHSLTPILLIFRASIVFEDASIIRIVDSSVSPFFVLNTWESPRNDPSDFQTFSDENKIDSLLAC